MKLRGIEFGSCWDAPGIRGWKGEGYWYHHLPIMRSWLSMKGSTFVAKTTTFPPRIPPEGGNMPVANRAPWEPLEWFPKSIWVDLWGGRTVNAVGLSGPGAKELLFRGLLDKRPGNEPYLVSFMSGAATAEERLAELKKFCEYFSRYRFKDDHVGLQLNISCPNVGVDPAYLMREALPSLDAVQKLADKGVPIVIKLNVLAPMEAVEEIADHPNCDALCVSNTIPFGTLPEQIPWEKLFPNGSPVRARVETYGNGGYSGPELLPLVADFVRTGKMRGIKKPWNAGGGIRSAKDVEYLVSMGRLRRGEDSIFFASAAMVRPWNVPGIIRTAHRMLD